MTHKENFEAPVAKSENLPEIEKAKAEEVDLSRQIAETNDLILEARRLEQKEKIADLEEYLGELKKAREEVLKRAHYWKNRVAPDNKEEEVLR